MIASIPSPGSNSISIGPLELRAYGLMIALGVLAAVWLAQRQWARKGGDPEDIVQIAMWCVPAGLIGSRMYHVATDWKRFNEDGWLEAFEIWNGGLGIPGGVAAGILMALWLMKSRGWSRSDMLDSLSPALPLAQAIGRFGNWFNQELFGEPTDLPWGLEIDESHRPIEHLGEATFHPTFLYESLWNLGLCGFLVWLDTRKLMRRGSLLAVYILGYGIGRLWIEAVRIDPASLVFGVRINIWMSLALITGSVIYLAFRGRPFKEESSEDAVIAG